MLKFFEFALNITMWYAFTVLSTVFSKKLLDLDHTASHTLTLASLSFALPLKLIAHCCLRSGHHQPARFRHLNQLAELSYLGLFNIATILMTNLGISETSISLTYMVKVHFKSLFPNFFYILEMYFIKTEV